VHSLTGRKYTHLQQQLEEPLEEEEHANREGVAVGAQVGSSGSMDLEAGAKGAHSQGGGGDAQQGQREAEGQQQLPKMLEGHDTHGSVTVGSEPHVAALGDPLLRSRL
jgi:hypothetical protein